LVWEASPFLVAAVLALFPVGWEGIALTAAAALIGT
jgi:hypothetical protein